MILFGLSADAYFLFFQPSDVPVIPVYQNSTTVATSTTATDMSDWKTYTNSQYGFELKYPSKLNISESNGLVVFSHSIPYKNNGDCDMIGGNQTFKDLTDFKISILITKNPDTPSYTDGNYKSGQLSGTYSYLGAEGCGEIGYYFPTANGKTLVVKKDAVQALSGLSTVWNLNEILKVPGVISKEESQKIFDQVLSTFKFISTSVPITNTSNSGISGTVTIGPTCPVQRIPPDPQCADRPYQAGFNVTNQSGQIVKSFTSDANGKFSVDVVPGTYTISSATNQALPRFSPQTVLVTKDKYTIINLQFDSGIR